MNDVLLVAVIAGTAVRSATSMVIGIVRLITMRRVIKQALDKSGQAQIPSVLRAAADLASTLTADRSRTGPSSSPRTAPPTPALGRRTTSSPSVEQEVSTVAGN